MVAVKECGILVGAAVKKLIVLVLALILLGVIAGIFLLGTKQTPIVPPTSEVFPSSARKQYTDSSGFTFSYPTDLTLQEKGALDSITYADVTLTASKTKGKTTVTVADTQASSLDVWISANNKLASPTSLKTVTLGGLDAREVRTNNTIITAAIDQGVLFVIKTLFNSDQPFWPRVHEVIASSFSVGSTDSESAGDGEVVVEEEVIE